MQLLPICSMLFVTETGVEITRAAVARASVASSSAFKNNRRKVAGVTEIIC
jgi:hypothetical protein